MLALLFPGQGSQEVGMGRDVYEASAAARAVYSAADRDALHVAVADEAEAVRVAKQYLSYFQGPFEDWSCADQRRLRGIVPENRLRIYDVREVIETLADTDSVLELRRGFGPGMVTALARVEGRPLGIVANNPTHLAGAIDSNGADKAARFMQLCDAFDLPILFLCDTPGIMVGPEVEKTALVRHASRMFVTGGSLTVPFFTIVLRKAYGLGAQAMAGGSFSEPMFAVAWPTGEFGGMGLEGQATVGALDLLLRGVAFNPQDLVVVALGSHVVDPPTAPPGQVGGRAASFPPLRQLPPRP